MISKIVSIIMSIWAKLIKPRFINIQLKPNILINTFIYNKKRYILIISKISKNFSKLVANAYQLFVKGKIL